MTQLSIEEMAGQRLMLGFDGQTLNARLKYLIKEIKTGGIILFKPNIESPEQLKTLCADARQFALDCGLPDLFIAVDQEGGVVARLRRPFTEFPGNPHVRTRDQADEFARVTAGELLDMGINMNMAPVLDVAPEGVDSIMKERVFPGDEDLVTELGVMMIQGFQRKNIMAVAKHFPGIGRTVKDSHFSLPVLDAGLAALRQSDIKPFEAARDAGVSGIMLSHISYPRLDNTWQASLSPAIARDLLRRDLGYEGLVMTDDLDMKAISHDMETCIRQIMISEIDLALICHSGPNIQKARDEVVRLLETDAVLFDLGNASVRRILGAKKRFLRG
ncbi:MAG: beta-N-acetylhexosaminidase [Desulfobacterales bacterium]|nr:beta-N-acetylhexosaminidase [Desulfobacterales bacterium]